MHRRAPEAWPCRCQTPLTRRRYPLPELEDPLDAGAADPDSDVVRCRPGVGQDADQGRAGRVVRASEISRDYWGGW
jgi:hypothetical protein